MNLRTELANSKNYGGSRNTSTIRYLVIHYTANDGDSDQNNGLYFKNNYVGASAHYFVDSDSVTQSVPDDRIAWHCGSSYGYKHPTCRNSNSIGIELCDDRKNGVIYPTNETIANALELVEYLMNKYSIPKENVIRHYDVTGKLCPGYWSGNANNDNLWKTEFWNKIGNNKVNTPTVTPTTPTATNKKMYRIFNSSGKQLGAYSNIENVLTDAKTRLLNGEDVKLTVRNK